MVTMGFLYGDSSPSPLTGNFLEFLRETLDFCVRSLRADQRIDEQRAKVATLQRNCEASISLLEKLGSFVASEVQRLCLLDADPVVENCGATITRTATELVRADIVRLRSVLSTESAKLEAQAATERVEVVKALESLFLRHDLPESALRTHLRLIGGTRYSARLLAAAPFGLEVILDLEIPAGHLFATAVRVDRVVDRIEVLAPDPPGRLKESKPRPHRLERCFVTEFALGVTGSALKLRETLDGAAGGFDILFGDEEQRPRLIRVGEREETSPPLADMSEADASRLRVLCERLAAPAIELNQHRRALVEAHLDGHSLATLERPLLLVERLIQHLGPIVHEIAMRSSSPEELVLRRPLSDDRREEIFVSKSELRRKLEPLPPPLRGLFAPLGLESSAG
jgi:hypothetical protein